MSFLIDPPMLAGAGAVIGRVVPEEVAGRRLRRLVVAGFLAASVGLYVNAAWTRWLWRICGAESGRDWMLNSGVFSFEHRNPSPAVHVLAAALFATYPVWAWAGERLTCESHRSRGLRDSHSQGRAVHRPMIVLGRR